MNNQKQIPILFSTMMVQAMLAGRKGNTRRTNGLDEINDKPDEWEYDCMGMQTIVKTGDRFLSALFKHKNGYWEKLVKSPYGQPGDILWVKETHFQVGHWQENGMTKTGKGKWEFVPDFDEVKYFDNPPSDFLRQRNKTDSGKPMWYKRNSLFMPKEAARIWLQVEEIRVERLRDISEEDAVAEGILSWRSEVDGSVRYKDYLADSRGYGDPQYDYPTVGLPVTSFCTLIQSIHGPDIWYNNHWVWVVKFKVLSTTGKPAELS